MSNITGQWMNNVIGRGHFLTEDKCEIACMREVRFHLREMGIAASEVRRFRVTAVSDPDGEWEVQFHSPYTWVWPRELGEDDGFIIARSGLREGSLCHGRYSVTIEVEKFAEVLT